MSTIPRNLLPFHSPFPQPDAPHFSTVEYWMAVETAGVYYRGCGNCHHFVFPHYDKAAIAEITALDTWTKFVFTGDNSVTVNAQFPWHHQKQFGKVRGLLRVVTDHAVSFSLRLTSNDLVDAVAESTGDPSQDAYISRTLNDAGWRALNTGGNNGFKLLERVVDLRSPTLPANNRIAIFPEIKITEDYYSLISMSGTVNVYLHSLVLLDLPESDVE